jgi:serine/threonine-protein kinase
MHAGLRIGIYELLGPIGRGGMGEVWKALDTKLLREVAIKTLPQELAADPERIARLEREATLLATLSHPHIASIYGLEELDGRRFLVLELIDGSTLEQTLLGGRLPIEQALKISLQIAAALEGAHEKGIIHRDLKPANVKITTAGHVKVLDFGLAKSLAPTPAGLPTLTSLDTGAGAVMGTPWYMSPEQARGEEAGRQTDIWSFGVLLYQLLTGTLPFTGKSATETLARVLESRPDLSKLPADLPPAIAHLLRRCLEKDPKRRYQHAGDLRIEIEDALVAKSAMDLPTVPARRSRRGAIAAAIVGAIALAAAGVVGRSLFDEGAPALATPIRLSMPFATSRTNLPFGVRALAVSPDGTRVALAGRRGLWIRALDSTEPIVINVTASNPFFSPDGESIGFFYDVGDLGRVPAAGGTPVVVARNAERPAGGTWGTDGSIVFATTAGLFRVPATGGEPELIAEPERARNERLYAWPQYLPGNDALLFTRLAADLGAPAEIGHLDLDTRESKVVVREGTAARFARTGHLVYAIGTTLNAIAFDPETGATHGQPIALPDLADHAADTGAAEFDFAASGTLVTVAPQPPAATQTTLSWVSRDGTEEPLGPGAPPDLLYPRISPDGSLIAVDYRSAGNRDIWILDINRQSLTRLTNGPTEDMLPVWGSDGRRVFFASNRGGTFDVYSQAADGATSARLEVAAPGFQAPNSFSPDGAALIVYENFHDVSVLDVARGELKPLLRNEIEHRLSELSPDGRWLAYESAESGNRMEIFLRPFPDVTARREKISLDGGRYPLWGPPGSNELYYMALDGSMMAAAIVLEPTLELGAVTKLFDWTPPPSVVTGRPYDISRRDGRFLMTKPAPSSAGENTNVSVVLHWLDQLRAAR